MEEILYLYCRYINNVHNINFWRRMNENVDDHSFTQYRNQFETHRIKFIFKTLNDLELKTDD